jgi:hypothetical protein
MCADSYAIYSKKPLQNDFEAAFALEAMVGREGLEPATKGL